jgi:hypothetical protein
MDPLRDLSMSAFSNNSIFLIQAWLSGVTKPLTGRPLAKPSSPISTEKEAQDEIGALRTELDKQKRRMVSPPGTSSNSECVYDRHELPLKNKSSAETVTAPRPLKGASLANPNKKARKYEAIEFESDEE